MSDAHQAMVAVFEEVIICFIFNPGLVHDFLDILIVKIIWHQFYESVDEAFFENRALEFSDLEKVIKNTVPLSTTQREQIIAIREWANVRAVTATKKDDLTSYSTDDDILYSFLLFGTR